MMLLKGINLGLRFILELCVLTSLGYWGFSLDKGVLIKWVAGIGAPLVAAIIWGTFIAPKSPYLVEEPLRLGIELLIFGSAFFALYVSGQTGIAWIFAVAVVLNRTLMMLWKQ